ncbi:MAG: zinc ribbon domain-containing protein [Chloroflexi bacterium]|jgi:putative FmdB family regulatory protein|nr:zinc ribbon domain-containing protein [Chloroflexota bacterium]
MPTYGYKCDECGVRFERFQHFSEEPVKVCPECGGPVRRVIHPVGIVFKGSGFYVTDNRSGSSTALPGKKNGESKDSASSSSTSSESSKSSEK